MHLHLPPEGYIEMKFNAFPDGPSWSKTTHRRPKGLNDALPCMIVFLTMSLSAFFSIGSHYCSPGDHYYSAVIAFLHHPTITAAACTQCVQPG